MEPFSHPDLPYCSMQLVEVMSILKLESPPPEIFNYVKNCAVFMIITTTKTILNLIYVSPFLLTGRTCIYITVY
jgi:hypothetical protein